jgi:hypothetical protein
MEYESSHYVPSRLSIWCPICGASAGQGCKEVKGEFMLRYASHNAYALGQVARPAPQQEPTNYVPAQRTPTNRPRWTPNRWVQ